MKEQFEKLKKQFNLPDFNTLNNDFEISTIEDEEFLIRCLRRKIVDKISDFLKVIEPIIQPDTTISDMQESDNFTETERNDVFDLYKKLKIMDKEALELSIIEDDKSTAEFITMASKQWPMIKERMKEISRKLQNAWEKEIVSKEEASYLR